MQPAATRNKLDEMRVEHCLQRPEEYGVTFQVALIGTGGLVIGSDTRLTYMTPGNPPSFQLLDGPSKFCASDDSSVICAYAGGPASKSIALEIACRCSAGNVGSELQWEKALGNAAKSVDRPPVTRIMDEVLVVRKDNAGVVWLVTVVGGTEPNIQKVIGHICTGDNSAARFIPRNLWAESLGMRDLETLALLTLSYATRDNPSGVGGDFEILSLRADGELTRKTWRADRIIEGEMCIRFANGLSALFRQLPEP